MLDKLKNIYVKVGKGVVYFLLQKLPTTQRLLNQKGIRRW